MAVTPGERLGPYEVVAQIAVGGMGEVYRATDTRLGREVALKILPDHLAGKSEALERFEAEARTIASLSHPNILSIFEFDRLGDRTIVVAELLEGRPLEEFVRAQQMFPDFGPVYSFIGHTRAQSGDLAPAIESYERALQLGAGPETRGWLGHAYARAGRTEDASRCDAELVRISASRYVSPAVFGFVSLGRGDRKAALARITRAAVERALYPQLMLDARFDELRDEPAFIAIDRQIRPSPRSSRQD